MTPVPHLAGLCCLVILLIASPQLGAREQAHAPGSEGRIDGFLAHQDGAGGSEQRLSRSDRAFLLEAHQIGMIQANLAALAQTRRSTPAVQSHSRRVLGAERASLMAIEKMARDGGLELERGFTPESERRAEALRAIGPSGFASAFFGQMLDMHEQALALYERAASRTDNDDLRSLIEDSLPTLRTQLADAEQFSTNPGTTVAR